MSNEVFAYLDVVEIKRQMDGSRIQWKVDWVKGHQTNNNTLESKLNVRADTNTNLAYKLWGKWESRQRVEPLPSIGWNFLNESAVHTGISEVVLVHLQEQR